MNEDNLEHSNQKNVIRFNPSLYRKLKRNYKMAVDKGWDRFSFEGNILMTAYAKYLIQYLAIKFEKKHKDTSL